MTHHKVIKWHGRWKSGGLDEDEPDPLSVMDDYDEDLSQNAFYKSLQSSCSQLYDTATENRWMVSPYISCASLIFFKLNYYI